MCGKQRGLTLVETLAALALLAGVMLSSLSLFVQASRSLRSGADATRALAVASSILEETGGWGLRQLYLEFGRDGAASRYRFDSSTEPAAARWQGWLDRSLHDASALLQVEALGDSAGVVPALSLARAVRVTVTVGWLEEGRRRGLVLMTVRM